MEHWHNPSSIIGRLIEKDKCVNIAESCRRWSCWKCEETKAFVMRRRKKFLHPPFLRQDFTLDSTLALNLSKLCLSISGACSFQVHQVLQMAPISFFFSPPSYLSLNISCIPGLPQAYCYSSGWPSTSDLPATISQVLEFQVCVPYQVGVLQGIKPKASICQVITRSSEPHPQPMVSFLYMCTKLSTPNIGKAEARGSGVQCQLKLHNEFKVRLGYVDFVSKPKPKKPSNNNTCIQCVIFRQG